MLQRSFVKVTRWRFSFSPTCVSFHPTRIHQHWYVFLVSLSLSLLVFGPFGNSNDVSSLEANCPLPCISAETLKGLLATLWLPPLLCPFLLLLLSLSFFHLFSFFLPNHFISRLIETALPVFHGCCALSKDFLKGRIARRLSTGHHHPAAVFQVNVSETEWKSNLFDPVQGWSRTQEISRHLRNTL